MFARAMMLLLRLYHATQVRGALDVHRLTAFGGHVIPTSQGFERHRRPPEKGRRQNPTNSHAAEAPLGPATAFQTRPIARRQGRF